MNYSIDSIISYCMSMIYLSICFTNINPYRLTIKQHLIMISSISLLYILLNEVNPQLGVIPIYATPIISLYLKSKKTIESLFLGISTSIIIILVDNLVASINIFIFSEEFISSPIGYYMTFAFIGIALFIVSYFIGKMYEKHRQFFYEIHNSKYLILVLLVLILTFALFYFNINWNTSSDAVVLTKINGLIFILYGSVMILICGVSFFFIKKESDLKYKQIQLDNLKEYTDKLEKLYMDMRKFRHDYINIISTMAGFIEERDMDALERHFNNHIYPLNKNNYKLGLLKNIQLSEIKGLISAKVIYAQEKGVDVLLEIAEPILKINMDIIDLSRILGILLDNAIESSIESTDKKLNIAFINKSSSIIIVIVNTFKGKMPPISKLFEQGFSTKGENRGLGLSNLKDIVGKYKNITLDTYIEDDKFYQEISISNK